MTLTRKQLDSAERGTNLHTLIEKSAFFLYSRIRNETAIENWNRAKEIISEYHPLNNETTMAEELLKRAQYICEERQALNRPGDHLDDWDKATESLAKDIIWRYFTWNDTHE